nr:uncharacterized serine-rich protein C1E8.05 [Ipomoea batatas]GMD35100.1 uncharacterized serine-rich protein C1E8.05 [Ipomoea batatas]
MATASAAVLSSASSKAHTFHTNDDGTGKKTGKSSSTAATAAVPPRSDKFAPRFDGLRFIETLVTAHR